MATKKTFASTKRVKKDEDADVSKGIESKDEFMSSKLFARSLSKHKMVYARDGDEEDTVILKDFYKNQRNRQFGVKGV